MKRILILPDIHNHVRETEAQIARYSADWIVFLGDYFDSFGDAPSMAAETAEWLKDSLSRPGRIHLFGNHDLWYAFPSNEQIRHYEAGFSDGKLWAIEEILDREDWQKFKLVEFVDGICISHAGISPEVFRDPERGLTTGVVEERCAEALLNAAANRFDPVFELNGVVWLRWGQLPLLPEFSQVVGHSPEHELRVNAEDSRFNLCLDTFGRYVGLIEDGAMMVIDDHREAVVWRAPSQEAQE